MLHVRVYGHPAAQLLSNAIQVKWQANEHVWGKQEIHFRTRKSNLDLVAAPIEQNGEGDKQEFSQKNVGIVIGSQLEWGQIEKNGKVFWDYNASTRRRSNFQKFTCTLVQNWVSMFGLTIIRICCSRLRNSILNLVRMKVNI